MANEEGGPGAEADRVLAGEMRRDLEADLDALRALVEAARKVVESGLRGQEDAASDSMKEFREVLERVQPRLQSAEEAEAVAQESAEGEAPKPSEP